MPFLQHTTHTKTSIKKEHSIQADSLTLSQSAGQSWVPCGMEQQQAAALRELIGEGEWLLKLDPCLQQRIPQLCNTMVIRRTVTWHHHGNTHHHHGNTSNPNNLQGTTSMDRQKCMHVHHIPVYLDPATV